MKTVLLLTLLSLFLVPLRAEDWTTLDGKTYQNVRVLSHNAGYVTILHENGGGRIPLSTLKPEVRARFGYDPAKAQAVIAATKAADQRDKAALAQERVALRAQEDRRQKKAADALASALFPPPSDAVLMASGSPANDAFSNTSLNGPGSPVDYGGSPSDDNGGYSAYYGYEDGYGNDLGYGYGEFPYYGYGGYGGYGGYFSGYSGYGFGSGRSFSSHWSSSGHSGRGHHH